MTTHKKDRTTFIAHALACICLLALMARPTTAQGAGQFDVRPLPSGGPVERQLAGGEAHFYELMLEAGAALRLDLEEKGVNCALAIVPPSADPNDGFVANFGLGFDRETFTFIARDGGKHMIGVMGRGNGRGAYSLVASVKRVAGVPERQRAEASRISAEGFERWHDSDKARDIGATIRTLETAVNLWKELKEDYWVGYTSNALGRIYSTLSQKQKALEYLNAALESFRKVGHKRGQAIANNNLAIVHADFGEFETARKLFSTSLALREEIGDDVGRANVLTALGAVYSESGAHGEALSHYEKALSILRVLKDADAEANTRAAIGTLHTQLGDLPKALDTLNQAWALVGTTRDASLKSRVLNELAAVHEKLGDFRKALDYYQQSLAVSEASAARQDVGRACTNIGSVYFGLGELQKALEYVRRALAISREIGDDAGVVHALTNLSTLYSVAGDERRMLETLAEASSILLEGKAAIGPQLRASLLLRVGNFFLEHNISDGSAANVLREAVEMARTAGDVGREAEALNSLAHTYQKMGDERQSKLTFYQSLLAASMAGDPDSVAGVLANLMRFWSLAGNPRFAAFYGKESINKYQQLRTRIRGLDGETQKAYVRRRATIYAELAQVLLEQGRHAEALQVVNASQDQQFYDFDRGQDAPAEPLALTPREAAFASEHRRVVEQLITAGRRLEDLQRVAGERPAPEVKAQLDATLEQVKAASVEFIDAFMRASDDFSRTPRAGEDSARVEDLAEMQAILRELSAATGQRTAALYTITGGVGFRALLVTPDSVATGAHTVTPERLDEKVLQYYALLQTPGLDPRPLGKEFYDIIVKPVEPALRASGAQTLIWSLGGALRYVPMASLWDGEKYLVERYRHVVFTRPARERMTRAPRRDWTGVGFGSSRAQAVDPLGGDNPVPFDALPGVLEELRSIFGTSEKGGGVVRGRVLADEGFTKASFLGTLKGRYPLVHVASHFSFRPGDDAQSFLLLGDGTALTLREIKQQAGLFEGVELLTLSACNTAATRADAMGREIDGFAESAQRLGAAAVMATLWTVADNSTSGLMREFYRARQSGALTKADALRAAQLTLLKGAPAEAAPPKGRAVVPPRLKVELVDASSAYKERVPRAYGRGAEVVYVEKTKAPTFHADRDKPFAHPYYWAPFILIGNGR